MATYEIKRNDTEPPLRAQLVDQNGPIPLIGAEVRLHMRQEGGRKYVAGLCTITDANGGWVRYDWQPGDTTLAGIYRVEWEIVFAAGTPDERTRTVPNSGYEDLVVLEDLG